MSTSALQTVFKHIDTNKAAYIASLKDAVAIKSVSCSSNKREECMKMVTWMEERLKILHANVEVCNVGKEDLWCGKVIKRPPVLLAAVGKKAGKKTLCVYGHLDVAPAHRAHGWDSDPFTLEERDGKLFGRGTSDNKGPLLCWIHAIEAFQANKLEVPVNIKLIIECMEEVGSQGIEELLAEHKAFFRDVDFVCISDGTWAGNKKPCVSHGARGLLYFNVEVEGPSRDLHSGIYGGILYEPLADLIMLLNSLQDHKAKLQIKGLMDPVLNVTAEEERLYRNIDFDVGEVRQDVGVPFLNHKDSKTRLLIHRWRLPSLSFHGIDGAYSEPGGKTIIPAKVSGKFSLRLVHHQVPDQVATIIQEYLQSVLKLRKSSNTLKVSVLSSSKSWSDDPRNQHYAAACKAVQSVYNVEPDLIQEGSSIKLSNLLHDVTEGKSVVLLPLSKPSDGLHCANEKLDTDNYIQGTKVFAAYMHEISLL